MTDNRLTIYKDITTLMKPSKPEMYSREAKLEAAAVGLEATAKICRILAEDSRRREEKKYW